jgi:hypothetical protein
VASTAGRGAPYDDFLVQTPVKDTSGAMCWFNWAIAGKQP